MIEYYLLLIFRFYRKVEVDNTESTFLASNLLNDGNLEYQGYD